MAGTEVSTLDRCSGRQLKELLALAATDTKAPRDWLLEVGDLETMNDLLTEMCAGTEQSGSALLQAVCSPQTSVEVLTGVKSTAKRLSVAAEAPAQKAAATLLYHLAVAAALGHHAQNISSKNPVERLSLYQDLALDLCDDKLAAVFEKAIACMPPESR